MEQPLMDEHVQRLLEEVEQAMRLHASLTPGSEAARDVKAVLDNLFRDLGRTVYNLYWAEPDLRTGERGAELAPITSEMATDAIALEPREVVFLRGGEARPLQDEGLVVPAVAHELPETDGDYLLKGTDSGEVAEEAPTDEDDGSWYTNEVEIPAEMRQMFSPEDGLREDVPEGDPASPPRSDE